MHSHRGLVFTVRGYNTLIAQRRRRRVHVLPAAVPHRRALGGEYFSLYTGAMLNFVENPETVPENVREIAPTVFTAVPARVGEVLFRRDDRPEGGQPAAAGRVRLEHRRGHADRRQGDGRPAGGRLPQVEVHAGARAGAEQRAQDDRHPPLALPGHWRGADLARPGEVVPRAGRADAGGVGHDRVVRRRPRACRPRRSSPARSARPPPTTR